MADKNLRESEFRRTGVGETADDYVHDGEDRRFALMPPREQLSSMLRRDMSERPFSELYSVSLDHRGATIVGHALLDALEERGFSVDDFDAVGALTSAAVPLVCAMVQAASSRGQSLDAFVMDFVYPSVKGPSISGRRVVLVDSWLSEKSYVQTSSLVTLRNGNELSLDCGIIDREGASVVAVASVVGGVGESGEERAATSLGGDREGDSRIAVVDPVTGVRRDLPFVQVFDERELRSEAAGAHA
ncbi:orotate phosphoribosyltransferase [uncultured Bifidobacterium sp.]|uniref:orotate phosphoribosyltransferase n=1 Tax=uncultured Bifidobacterium sp. TaxID=165187 RepID=UPI0026160104|nr:orotate phosphoribosyltransferase [uncultured Bifidobacterium sp.]